MRQTLSAAGAGAPLIFNQMAVVFGVGIGVTLSAGANLTYTVQYTYDDVFDPAFNPTTANWFNIASLTTQTANKDANFVTPVMAVRLNVTSYTSGSVTINTVQAAT
jgi:hypothetical protein